MLFCVILSRLVWGVDGALGVVVVFVIIWVFLLLESIFFVCRGWSVYV